MKVTKEQVMQLCEELNKLKRLGDMLADGKEYKDEWRKETVASCELANSVMNNMTSVDGDHSMDIRTRLAQSILLNILTHEQSKPTFMLDKINELARRAVLLADAMINQLAEAGGNKITSEDSSLASLEADAKQAKDDEAWALRHAVHASRRDNLWRFTCVDRAKSEYIIADGLTMHAALRALREKVEGGAK